MSGKITRVELACKDNEKRVYINFKDTAGFLHQIDTEHFPNCPENADMTVYIEENDCETPYKLTFGEWLAWDAGKKEDFAPSRATEVEGIFKAIESSNPIPSTISIDSKEDLGKLPELTLTDITEKEFFGFDAIIGKALEEEDTGIWAYHGLRKFSFELEHIPFPLLEQREVKYEVGICFVKKGNHPLPKKIFLEKISILEGKQNREAAKEGTYLFHGYVDTNQLGEAFEDNSDFEKFEGALELTCSMVNEEYLSRETRSTVLTFPFEVTVHNTDYYPEKADPCPRWDKDNFVSIDFGTSSTCVAVHREEEDRVQLLSLSQIEGTDENDDNLYENPTSLMICDWDALYRQWTAENKNFPHFRQGSYTEHRYAVKNVEYNVGYGVNHELVEPEREVLQAILTQIKMLPYQLKDGKKIALSPIVKGDCVEVKLVDSPDKQDKESLDAVAFYAYLLGRAINNPRHKKIFSKFLVTYPVKFNLEVREKMRVSLEYGLRRSLPLPLREGITQENEPIFQVRMEKSEPEAYIGAICGTEYLPAEENKPALFAVYDFGGGTLDFAYGMYNLDEDALPEFGFTDKDGDPNIGAENLISLISYWIYSENEVVRDTMAELRIPFVKPARELQPNGFPEALLCNSMVAKTNMRLINEAVSRKLFKGQIDVDQEAATTLRLDLRNEENEPVESEGEIGVSLPVEYAFLQGKLREVILASVKKFERCMGDCFNKTGNQEKMAAANADFSMDKVKIFRAGNASRSQLVEEAMKEVFPNNEVTMVDESKDDTVKDVVAITPKTAVAFGQLASLQIPNSSGNKSPFAYNIHFKHPGTGAFEAKIKPNHQNTGWEFFSAVRGNGTELYCSSDLVKTKNDPMHPVKIPSNKKTTSYLYLRVHDEETVEYYLSDEKVTPDSSLPVDMTKLKKVSK
ncbi:MAG: hypothetical protein R3Y63_07570 [Eubacteriales bacterium]